MCRDSGGRGAEAWWKHFSWRGQGFRFVGGWIGNSTGLQRFSVSLTLSFSRWVTVVERNGATHGTLLAHLRCLRRLGRIIDMTAFCFGKSVDALRSWSQTALSSRRSPRVIIVVSSASFVCLRKTELRKYCPRPASRSLYGVVCGDGLADMVCPVGRRNTKRVQKWSPARPMMQVARPTIAASASRSHAFRMATLRRSRMSGGVTSGAWV